jgi:hypothetical protein
VRTAAHEEMRRRDIVWYNDEQLERGLRTNEVH